MALRRSSGQAGYFQSLAGHAVPPGPRIRPVAAPYGSTDAVSEPEPWLARRAIEPIAAKNVPAPPRDPQSPDLVQQARPHRDRPSPPPVAAPPAIACAEASTENDTETARAESTVRSAPVVVNRVETIDAHQRAAVRDGLPRTPSARPAVSAPRSMPATAQARMPPLRDASPSRHDDPPDVHIHIGRIELTAVTPPAAPRRQTPPPAKAMPLDEYLQRRNRKAR